MTVTVLTLLCNTDSWWPSVVWHQNHTSMCVPFKPHTISTFWEIINVTCFLLLAAPSVLFMGPYETITIAQWAHKNPDKIKESVHIPGGTDVKTTNSGTICIKCKTITSGRLSVAGFKELYCYYTIQYTLSRILISFVHAKEPYA